MRDHAHGLHGHDFWARGSGPRSQQSCSRHLQTPCSRPGAALRPQLPASMHDKESTGPVMLHSCSQPAASANIHSHFAGGEGEAQQQ